MIKIARVECSPRESQWDVKAKRTLAELPLFFLAWKNLGVSRAMTAELYFIHCPEKWTAVKKALAEEILTDPITQMDAQQSVFPPDAETGMQWWCLEKMFRPGVTDNAGQVLAEAIRLVTGQEYECRSGSRLWIELPREVDAEEVKQYADQVFYNALIEKAQVMKRADAHEKDEELFKNPQWFEFSHDEAGLAGQVETFELRDLTVPELCELSNQRLWALTRKELEAIRSHFVALGRPMTDVEIEVLAQTWSEHCKHKIFAAKVRVKNERADLDLPDEIDSVFKTYIRGATKEIPAPFLKSVFEDNAGIINVTQEWDCAIKVETHNSPSALDPYGGALTGIVGVNRDILGAGMGAKPIANLDVFCVGDLDYDKPLPPRLHHPRRILEGVRVGVEHGGNKSGIPTVTGAVVHHPGYLGKPLIYCGTIGLLPANGARDFIHKKIMPGDRIVMVGGRIGKDGIHGATFSSLEMNEDSPISAVQLGDPLTQRRVWDFLIEARDQGLFRAVTDNGAGGLSSSIGEMARLCGKKGGARMDVAHAKTKYPGLKPFELVISESQERMSFAVPPEKLDEFTALAQRRGVECSVLGEFEDSGKFHILYKGESVGQLDMEFLHEGCPRLELDAVVPDPAKKNRAATIRRYGAWQAIADKDLTLKEALPQVLALPNVRSRREITRQYDHEVQARSIRKPYGSPEHAAPNDGAVLRLSRTSMEGVAVGLGLAPFAADIDPKVAAELSVDEALRNALASGMDPAHAVLVDNFCWPDPLPSDSNPDAHEKMGALVTTCKRLFDAAVTLRMPFVSGKDSMKNDYRMGEVKISVPPTILITAMGKVHDVRKIPKGHALADEHTILWVSAQDVLPNTLGLPQVSFAKTNAFATAFHELVGQGKIASAHDVSDGGWLVATAEMLFGTGVSAALELEIEDHLPGEPSWAALFGEPATSFVLMVKNAEEVRSALKGFTVLEVGETFIHAEREARLELTLKKQKTIAWKVSKLSEAYHHA